MPETIGHSFSRSPERSLSQAPPLLCLHVCARWQQRFFAACCAGAVGSSIWPFTSWRLKSRSNLASTMQHAWRHTIHTTHVPATRTPEHARHEMVLRRNIMRWDATSLLHCHPLQHMHATEHEHMHNPQMRLRTCMACTYMCKCMCAEPARTVLFAASRPSVTPRKQMPARPRMSLRHTEARARVRGDARS